MTYTFWHSGTLLGESDLALPSTKPGQQGGVFHPTVYGLTMLPTLTCGLSASRAFQRELSAMGKRAEDLSNEDIASLIETSDATAAMVELGRILGEIELRAPDGQPIPFETIAFSDVEELRRTGHTLIGGMEKFLPANAPRYLVSATRLASRPSLRAMVRQPSRAIH